MSNFVEKDGIIADVRAVADQIVVRWRFMRRPDFPLKAIEARIDGKSLGVPVVQGYPLPGEETHAIAMLDVSGDRADAMPKQAATTFAVARGLRDHVRMAFATYAEQLRILSVQDGAELLAALIATPMQPVEPNTSAALRQAIEQLSLVSAQRRVVLILGDGHFEPGFRNDLDGAKIDERGRAATVAPCEACASGIVALARRNGVAIMFVLFPSKRTIDIASLQAMALGTGGVVVEEGGLASFVKTPFAVVDGGGTAFFPLAQKFRFFWQSDPQVTVDVAYGDRHLHLGATAPLTEAGVTQTAAYLWNSYYLVICAAGGGVIALLMIPVFARRRGKPVPDDRSDIAPDDRHPLALLQDVNDGTIHAIYSFPARLGRARDNEIVLDESTVSRFHAVVMRADDAVVISNRSATSVVSVNNEPVQERELKDGDIIALGKAKLRFATAAGR